jgi:hypothetical protein
MTWPGEPEANIFLSKLAYITIIFAYMGSIYFFFHDATRVDPTLKSTNLVKIHYYLCKKGLFGPGRLEMRCKHV